MRLLDLRARNFWCAAYFFRHAPDRDRSIAVKVLEQTATTATGTIQTRAATMLKEINGTGTDEHPPRAG